jgi:quinol monooxygenase YgiN
MSEPIVYIDTSEIREGALEELKRAMNELVKFVETNEPRLIAYNVYIKEDGTRMTVVHVHRDSASLEFHMKVAGPAFPKFAEFIELLTIDVYGKLGDDLLEQVAAEGSDFRERGCARARVLRRVRSLRSPLSASRAGSGTLKSHTFRPVRSLLSLQSTTLPNHSPQRAAASPSGRVPLPWRRSGDRQAGRWRERHSR